MYDQADHRHYQQQVNHPARYVEGSPGNQPYHQQNEKKDQKQESHQSTPVANEHFCGQRAEPAFS
jgi:hypothetical protein